MPKRTDIQSILILGAGPIVIGQACEFDYSGAQACKALRDEGYRVILVNSNPATIMTDPEFADRTFNPDYLSESSQLYQDLRESTEMTSSALVPTTVAARPPQVAVRRLQDEMRDPLDKNPPIWPGSSAGKSG